MNETTLILPKGVRLRYLVRSPRVAKWRQISNQAMGWVFEGGDWERVWSGKWKRYRGEKKIVTGTLELVHVAALEGWEG